MELATFAAGCFWGIEASFYNVKGVQETRVGYTGGHTPNPSYEMVCRDTTGHAEAIEIIFNPKEISYSELLDLFWTIHDPTTLNRQGPDVGSQYRSAIFYHSQEQQDLALQSKDKHQEKWDTKIVTEILPATIFYPAESYHQKYFLKTGHFSCPKP